MFTFHLGWSNRHTQWPDHHSLLCLHPGGHPEHPDCRWKEKSFLYLFVSPDTCLHPIWTLFFIYVRPSSSSSLDISKMISLFHMILTPMATHSSTLAWRIPWTEEPGRLQSIGSQRVRHDWAISLSLFTFMHWRRKWQPTPVFLPGESQGWGSLVGCCLWGRTELDTTEAT